MAALAYDHFDAHLGRRRGTPDTRPRAERAPDALRVVADENLQQAMEFIAGHRGPAVAEATDAACVVLAEQALKQTRNVDLTVVAHLGLTGPDNVMDLPARGRPLGSAETLHIIPDGHLRPANLTVNTMGLGKFTSACGLTHDPGGRRAKDWRHPTPGAWAQPGSAGPAKQTRCKACERDGNPDAYSDCHKLRGGTDSFLPELVRRQMAADLAARAKTLIAGEIEATGGDAPDARALLTDLALTEQPKLMVDHYASRMAEIGAYATLGLFDPGTNSVWYEQAIKPFIDKYDHYAFAAALTRADWHEVLTEAIEHRSDSSTFGSIVNEQVAQRLINVLC